MSRIAAGHRKLRGSRAFLSPGCPSLFESQEICAKVSEGGAGYTGLAAGTPVVAGAGDQGAGAVGMGILAPGSVSATIGTSGVVFAATAAPTRDPQGRLHTFCHAVPGRWHVMGVTQAAGLSLRWLRDTIAPGVDYDTLTAAAAQVPAGSDGLLWTPYLLGERTPHLDSTARAAFVGLTAGHTRAHLVRAVLEGVAYSLKDTFTLFAELGIPVKGVRLGGGGARGPLWREIQAAVYGHTADVLVAEEGGAFGAALLAGVGAGVWPDLEAACGAAIEVAQQIEPDAKTVERYSVGYQAYRKVYPALKGIQGLASGVFPRCWGGDGASRNRQGGFVHYEHSLALCLAGECVLRSGQPVGRAAGWFPAADRTGRVRMLCQRADLSMGGAIRRACRRSGDADSSGQALSSGH